MNLNEKHMQICKEMNKLHEEKNKRYNNSFSKTYQKYGLKSACIRLEDKLQRFINLALNETLDNDKQESIEDTLIDMANYAVMTLMEIRKK
jgi:hypothetical protein